MFFDHCPYLRITAVAVYEASGRLPQLLFTVFQKSGYFFFGTTKQAEQGRIGGFAIAYRALGTYRTTQACLVICATQATTNADHHQ